MKTSNFFWGCCLAISTVWGMQAQTFYGTGAGASSTGTIGSGFGVDALKVDAGTQNTAVGANSLKDNSSGRFNSAVGVNSLTKNVSGDRNSALGINALAANTTGQSNCAVGSSSLFLNVDGGGNTAMGVSSLRGNVSGGENTAMGLGALEKSTTSQNAAFGAIALQENTTGEQNAAFGYKALWKNIDGSYNVALGNFARVNATTGNYNTVIGVRAMYGGAGGANTAVGYQAAFSVTGGNNTCLGTGAGAYFTTGTENTFVGAGCGDNAVLGSSYNTFIGRVAFPANTTINNSIILADGAGNRRFYIHSNGNAGIGLTGYTIPGNKLEINSGAPTGIGASGLRLAQLTSADNTSFTSNDKVLTVDGNGDVVMTKDRSIYSDDGTIVTNANPAIHGTRTITMGNNNIFFNTNGSDFVDGTTGTGRIYIGDNMNFPQLETTPLNSHYRLLVEGGILTEKVKVALRNGVPNNWADYVFADGYKLMPLREVEAFVKENKHLPGIESAQELQASGLDLADMQRKQMEKIEELTLHLIDQNKTIEKQTAQIEELKAQVKAMLQNKNN